MAEITTTQSFSDGDTVTATKLNNIQANASVQPDAITNRTAETTIDQANDLLLIYDASATALKKVSASNLIKAGTASDFPITGNATIGGTLGVTGTSALAGNTTVGGTLGVTGAITASTSTINVGSGQIYKDATGNVGVGTTTPLRMLHIQGSSSVVSGTARATLIADDTTAYAAGVGGAITFRGKYNSAGDYAAGGYIQSQKTNATNGNDSFDLVLGTRNSGFSAAEVLRLTSDGNVGVGTASPISPLHIRGAAGRYAFPATSGATQSNGLTLRLNDASDDNAILDIGGNSTSGYWLQATNNANLATNYPLLLNPNGGNVGVGTTSPAAKLEIAQSSGATQVEALRLTTTDANQSNQGSFISFRGPSAYNYDMARIVGARELLTSGGFLAFHTSNAERLRIDSSGSLLVGATSAQSSERLLAQNDSATNPSFIAYSPSATFTGYVARLFADRNTSNSTYNFLSCTRVATAGDVFIIRDSGNAVNTNNSYGAISDIKLKENIENASSQWDDIKSIQVRKFSFKNDEEHKRMLGLVAQEVELISPNLVETVIDRDKDGSDLGTTTKEVKYSVLYMKAVKALQEAMVRIEALESKVTALEAA